MSIFRAIVVLFICIAIIFFGMYQGRLNGDEKVGHIQGWVMYVSDDGEYDFYLIRGFEKMTLEEALLSEMFDEEAKEEISMMSWIYIAKDQQEYAD